MNNLEINSDRYVCPRCGVAYSRRKGYFGTSYAESHKGIGYVPICKKCVDSIYNRYLQQCNDARTAMRQTCRKIDLYYSNKVFDSIDKLSTNRTIMTQYISKLNSVAYAGRSYDDTLLEEGTLWSFANIDNSFKEDGVKAAEPQQKISVGETKVGETGVEVAEEKEKWIAPDDVIAFWGAGYSNTMMRELEQRRAYYMSKFPKGTVLDIGSEVLLRQICNLEVSIAQDRAEGKAIDKSVNALNTLLGSLNLKPIQKDKDDSDSAFINPLGVWLYRYENEKPLPKINKKFDDANGFKRNVFTWMGHVCKMLSKKNGYSKLYEDEIARLRVEKPEYADEDEETLFMDSLS